MQNKYYSHVKDRFDDIKKWLELGWTEKQIYKELGVSKDSWCKYKRTYSDLTDFLKKARRKPVEEIKSAMLKRATGFQYQETKITTQQIEYDDGSGVIVPAKVIKTEVIKKTALPDVGAGLVLLQHWDKEQEWSRDPANLKLKKKELELKAKQVEESQW